MASIIVLAPIYLALMWVIRRDIANDGTRAEVWVRRWAIILTLFVAGATIAIDLITLLTTFLSGDAVTTAFLLKVLVVLLVAAAVFMHFMADFWGYWTIHPRRRMVVFAAAAVLAVGSVVAGFFIVGTPGQARLYRFDDTKIQDLSSIQYQITDYYQRKQTLPTSLDDLRGTLSYMDIPVDLQTNMPYEYHLVSPVSFQLCATFNQADRSDSNPGTMYQERGVKGGENWQHEAGRVCFDRTIDPGLYPPISPVKSY